MEAVLDPKPQTQSPARRWTCRTCDWVYDEALGLPEDGIAPGTAFESIDADWFCPDCGVGKADFVPCA